jgi:hypothetical protein
MILFNCETGLSLCWKNPTICKVLVLPLLESSSIELGKQGIQWFFSMKSTYQEFYPPSLRKVWISPYSGLFRPEYELTKGWFIPFGVRARHSTSQISPEFGANLVFEFRACRISCSKTNDSNMLSRKLWIRIPNSHRIQG